MIWQTQPKRHTQVKCTGTYLVFKGQRWVVVLYRTIMRYRCKSSLGPAPPPSMGSIPFHSVVVTTTEIQPEPDRLCWYHWCSRPAELIDLKIHEVYTGLQAASMAVLSLVIIVQWCEWETRDTTCTVGTNRGSQGLLLLHSSLLKGPLLPICYKGWCALSIMAAGNPSDLMANYAFVAELCCKPLNITSQHYLAYAWLKCSVCIWETDISENSFLAPV